MRIKSVLLIVFLCLLCKFGECSLGFDGVDDNISIGDSSDFEFSDVTISFWVNFDADNIRYDPISKHGGSSPGGDRSGYGFFRDSSDETLYWSCAENSNWRALQGSTPISAGSWYHIVGVFSDASNFQKLYVNGVEDAADNSATWSIDYTVSVIMKAGSHADGNFSVEGSIKNIVILDTALTAEEVALIYNSGKVRIGLQIQPSNLQTCYALDDVIEGGSADGVTFNNFCNSSITATGSDGGNNTGLTSEAETQNTY